MTTAQTVAKAVIGFVTRRLEPVLVGLRGLESKFDAFQTQLDNLPVPQDGKEGPIGPQGIQGEKAEFSEEDFARVEHKAVAEVYASLQTPVAELVADSIEKAIAKVPPPLNGKDGASAFELARANGFVGDEEKWLNTLRGIDGLDGAEGKAGPEGAQGPVGPEGPTGATGPGGVDGAPGKSAFDLARLEGFQGDLKAWVESLRGKDGSPGQNGQDGPPGRDGADGIAGASGMSAFDAAVLAGFGGTQKEWLASLHGKDGPPGVNGTDGQDGTPGINGKDGQDGINGKDGIDGIDGKDGADGIEGKAGADGINGKDGVDGIDGKDGADGVQGKDGADGINGKDGINGNDGENGINGKDGAPGASVYEIAVNAGFEGTEKEWLEALKGKDGRDGDIGPIGPAGLKGDTGAAGESAYEIAVRKGYVGTENEWMKSIAGIDGRDGRDGPEGPIGKNGRDAYQLEILPGIDETKSYIRGSLAQHRGGLFRAATQTNGLDGWVCVVDGFDEIEVDSIDERNFKFNIIKSSGAVVTKAFKMPTMVHRGIYSESTQYEAGDHVTWAGSQWRALGEVKGIQPNTDDTKWKLSVKRGNDGKPGVPGLPGK